MAFQVTAEGLRRARETIHAAEVFFLHAAQIEAACGGAERGELVLAVVDGFGTFLGCWTVAKADLARTDRAMPEADWRLLFSPADRRAEIETRALILARQSMHRWQLMLHWCSSHEVVPGD